MLRPSMYQIISKDDSYYEFVVAVSLRAREIVELAEREHIQLTEKSVQLAVEEFATRKVKVNDYIEKNLPVVNYRVFLNLKYNFVLSFFYSPLMKTY